MSRRPTFAEEEQARALESERQTRQEQALSLVAQGWPKETALTVASYRPADQEDRQAALDRIDAYREQLSRRDHGFQPHTNDAGEVYYLGSSGSPGRLWRPEPLTDWQARYGYGAS